MKKHVNKGLLNLGIDHVFKILLMLSMIIQSLELSQNSYSFLTSMQQTNETFMNYMPFIQNCNYNNNPNISPGSISVQTANPVNLFEYYQTTQKIAFWSSIQNGLDILLQENVLLVNYSGIIYKPQIYNEDQNNISQNSTNDVLTLFKTTSDGNLTLYYVQVYVETNNNFSIQQTILQQNDVNVTTQLQTLIENCYTAKSKIVISQLDQQNYIGTCLNNSLIFFFSLNSSFDISILNLTNYNMSMPINNMILNPILQIQGVTQVGWNVFLLTNGSTQTYSCTFDPLNPTNFTAIDSNDFSVEFQQLIQKLWSQQNQILEVKIQKLISHLGPNAIQQFPGKIVSIYIDLSDNVYVQSFNSSTNLTYLNVFNWQKTQILNISFIGKILLYNSLEFLVQNYSNSNSFSIMTINLPMLSFGVNQVNNNNYTIQVNCSDGINNLIINYQLFMSNIEYPSAYTFEQINPNLYSNLSIYTFQLQNYFQVFGPGYTVYYKGPEVLAATLLDASIISMSTYILSIVEIIVAQSTANTIFRSTSVTYTTQNQIYTYTGNEKIHRKIYTKPCGIKYNLKGLKISDSQTIYYGYRDQSRSEFIHCFCPGNKIKRQKCSTIQKSILRGKIINKKQKLSQKLQKLQKLQLISFNYNVNINEDNLEVINPNYINNRLFTIVDQSLLVTIYNNNSVLLSNFWDSQFYDIINFTCSQLQSVVGSIYIKQFYDPSLYLFCQLDQYLYHYKIRSNQFIFQRIIPLYGFITRQNSSNILVGINYIFIQVQVNQNSNQNSTINIDPVNPNCCVLRIDPLVDTVSSIKQVIFAKSIQQVYQYGRVDVAYYSGSSLTSDDSFLKIYFDDTWMAINQTYASSPISTYEFKVVFASINYNLASQFSVNITYNMSSMGFVQNKIPLSNTIYLEQNMINSIVQTYSTTINFNYNGIQGPIQTSNIQSSDAPQIIQDVQLNQLIVQRKILGTVGLTYLQIFTPMQGKSKTTFDNSIIVVGSDQISVYLKNFNDQQMYLVSTYNLNYQNCKYYSFQILNYTSIQFVSDCQVPIFNLQIPMLTLNLTIINQTYATLGTDLSLGSVNIRLTNIKTVVFENTTYVFGIDLGPMQSLTGKLRYCSNNSICSVLYSSSRQYFLLYYDVFIYDINAFVVVTLDFQYVSIWLNPQLLSNSSDQIIPYNYTIYLPQYLDQDISIITLINATNTSFTAILSGTLSYYEVVYNYLNATLQIVTIFQRYTNCQTFDRFPVHVLLDQQAKIQALIAQCNQNQNILRLQTYQRVNSNSTVIFTGYLQYFSKFGPSSNLARPSIPAFNPIRILPLSNTMINKLFLLYQNQKNQIKLVYQQLDGILADNYVYLCPSLSITLAPLTTDLNFPSLSFSIQNDLYQLNYYIDTKPAPLNQLTNIELACLIIFIICNVLNIILMILYWIYVKQKQPRKVIQRQSIVAKSQADQDSPHHSFKDFKQKIKQRLSGFSIISRKTYTKRKQTQIQLFSKRTQ